jgi:hypothetical protein
VYFEVSLNDGTDTYYLTPGGWVDDSGGAQLIEMLNTASSQSYQKVSVTGEGIPVSGVLQVKVFQVWDDTDFPILVTLRVRVKEVNVMLYNTDETALDSDIEFITEIEENHNIILDDIEVLVADVPDTVNNVLLYENKKTLSDESATKLWQESGNTLQESMIVSLARIITDQYERPTISYDALIRHPHLSFGNIIWDPFDEMKYRILEISSYNDADCVMSLKVVEIIEPDVPAPVAPEIVSAEVPFLQPTKILLTFDKDLDEEFKPATTAFAVSDNTVSSITMNRETITITLGSALEDGAFTVTYTKPASNALVSAGYYIEVASFEEGGTYVEPVPPICTSAYLQEGEDDIIELYFSANLNESKVPQQSSFSVTDNTVGAINITDNLVIISLGTPQAEGVFTVGYTKPASNPITGVDGAEAASFEIEGST